MLVIIKKCLKHILFALVPSQPPGNFAVIAKSSTSITASWQLPPKYARHGIITGFKLFYKKRNTTLEPTSFTIHNRTTNTKVVAKLEEDTEYEFQVLAFTSVGDGPKSSVEVERTREDGENNNLGPKL